MSMGRAAWTGDEGDDDSVVWLCSECGTESCLACQGMCVTSRGMKGESSESDGGPPPCRGGGVTGRVAAAAAAAAALGACRLSARPRKVDDGDV